MQSSIKIVQLPNIDVPQQATITDYKFSLNGKKLAVSDSDGFIYIYTKEKDRYLATEKFKADEGSIWCINWANPQNGNLLGVGTFSNKVIVLQQQRQGWKQIAEHNAHEASVNFVQWASAGIKLFAGSTDGKISIFQPTTKSWKFSAFSTCQSPIITFALQSLPFGELIAQQHQQNFYPRIATVNKDMKIRIWGHKSQISYNENEKQLQNFSLKAANISSSGYLLINELPTPKQSVRKIIWRPSWGSMNESLQKIRLIYCTQEGCLKHIELLPSGQNKSNVIMETENSFTRISQSMTGNLLTASVACKGDKYETYVFQQDEDGQWFQVNTANKL